MKPKQRIGNETYELQYVLVTEAVGTSIQQRIEDPCLTVWSSDGEVVFCGPLRTEHR